MKTIVTHSAVIQKTCSNRNGSLETNTTDSAVTEKVSDPPVIQRTGSNQKGSSENNTEKQINTEIQDSATAPNTVADVKNPTNGSKKINPTRRVDFIDLIYRVPEHTQLPGEDIQKEWSHKKTIICWKSDKGNNRKRYHRASWN